MVGQAIIGRLRERFEQGQKIEIPVDELSDILGGEGLDDEWQSLYTSLSCNSRSSVDCADELMVQVKVNGINDPRLKLLLQRYFEIVNFSHFQENQDGDFYTPLPNYGL